MELKEKEYQKKILYQKWDVGAHTSFSGRICDSLWKSINYGMYTTQFFMGNPKGFNRAKISDHDIEQCVKILSRFPLHLFTHFPYIANLAGSKEILAWNGDSVQDRKTDHVLSGLQYELDVLSSIGKCQDKRVGIVIHPGNHVYRRKGIKAICKSINKLEFSGCAKLLLENSAGQGTSLATTFEEIADIINGVDLSKQEHIGVCIDTCHIYAYGTYDLSKISEVDRMFSDFNEKIGLDKFTLLHLNDSKCKMGTKKDRHACLGTGYIWENGFESLVYLLDKCKEFGIPMVLETHGLDMITLAHLR